MDDEDVGKCKFCNEDFANRIEHNNTVNHRFNFKIWEYNEYRKALINDRHGISLEVKEEVQNNFNFTFTYRKSRGKYEIKVTPEQLYLHDNTITFKCILKNSRKTPVYVTSINLLHSSTYFSIIHPEKYFAENEEGTFYQLPAGGKYTFRVQFNTNSSLSSYKIPLSCDFQTLDEKCFTIVRTFLVIVDDQQEEKEEKVKSPFTSKPWKDVKTVFPTTTDTHFTDKYPIPKHYMKLLSHGLKSFTNISNEEQVNLRKLTQCLQHLTSENYKDYWHTLLWLEERAQAVMLLRYNMEEVTMELINDDTLVLEVPGLAEKRPSIVVGDFILIRVTGDHTAYEGQVKRVNDKTIEIVYVNEELTDAIREDPATQLDVSFKLGRLEFERMHYAVDRVVQTGMVNTIFPKIMAVNCGPTCNLQDSDFYNAEIVQNSEQKKAVMKILSSVQTVPYIVFGPPGTGKTITIVEAILQIKKRTKKRILVCAPANSACDVIAQKLIPHCKTNELIRIHSSTREKNTIPDIVKKYSNMDDDEFRKVTFNELLSHRIVITTLVLIGKFKKDYKPDCVFVDEAAQASEPEADIALSFLSVGKQVVLAGDPKQLGPMVTDVAAKFGLGVSLLERLMDYRIYKPNADTGAYNANFITMLKLNFRSHRTILSIPNHLFYDNSLIPCATLPQLDPLVDIPVYLAIHKNYVKNKKIKKTGTDNAVEFYSISSKEKREGSSPSYFNLFEAKMVVKCVRALVNLKLEFDHKVKLDQIGVVTPYKRQVHKILEGLKHNGFQGVEVGTTESFQGREKRIIIISTVRAQHSLLLHDRKYNLGFVKHDQRFNVAVTRAISKLIVIGCPLVLRKDEKWDEYITLCKTNRTYFGDLFDFNEGRFKEDVTNKMKRFVGEDDQYPH